MKELKEMVLTLIAQVLRQRRTQEERRAPAPATVARIADVEADL